mmetsp:Transcript_21324/g.52496  ORF Transcript_21324/g.52496 Transcript_21324/m.52496 type:complete len:186 (-) Transcript_21324:56-613(-)
MKTSTAILATLLLVQLALAVPISLPSRRSRVLLEARHEQASAAPAQFDRNANTPKFATAVLPKATRSSGSDTSGGDKSKIDGSACGCILVSDGTAGLTCYDFIALIANSEAVKCTARPCSKSPHYKCVDSGATDMCVVKIDEAVQLHALAPGICMPKVVTRKNVFLQLGSGLGGDSSNRDSSKSD